MVLCAPSFAQSLSFEQLDWQGIFTSTADSEWCRVTIGFTGTATTRYFNLNVDGVWVVQNMGIDSLYGAGLSQQVSTTFDLGVSAGTDVSALNYVQSLTTTPLLSMPVGATTAASVADLSYRIGGEDSVDLGTPGAPDAPEGGNGATVSSSAKLPNIDSVDNQVQGHNECAPGAISNSLKYLQAAGNPKLPASVDTDIADIRPLIGTTAGGTPADWPATKAAAFDDCVMTTTIPATDIAGLIAAVNAGKDVELDLEGHVAFIAGVRQYANGRVELDIFDDNQTDAVKDVIRTVEIRGGKVDNMTVEKYVIEMALPKPIPTMTEWALISLLAIMLYLGYRSLQRRPQVTC